MPSDEDPEHQEHDESRSTRPLDATPASPETPAPTDHLVVVGGGNMGAALLGGMIESGTFAAADLGVVEVMEERRAELEQMFPGVRVTASIPTCAAVILAVKPIDAATAARAAAEAGATRVLSIAAGVRLDTLEEAAGPGVAVIRAMPNTPALVGQGAAAIAAGADAGQDAIDWAASILGAVGTVEVLPESLIDAFTGVAGSGPAYLFLVAEALIDAAVGEGFEREMAGRIVRQLMLGSAALLDRDPDPVRLRRQVTSPGGTTAAGIAVLEERALREVLNDAVRAATARSRELG